MGRWQPDSRGRLQEAALALYSERGFEQITAAQIADRAGVTERTFFRHFADKREVIFGGSVLQEQIAAGVAGAPAADGPLTPFPAASTPPPPCSASFAGTCPGSARP
jgi:AcrR family transcriptional regulator